MASLAQLSPGDSAIPTTIDSQNDRWSSLGLPCFFPVLEARAIILCCCCKYVDATETVASESKTVLTMCRTLGFASALFKAALESLSSTPALTIAFTIFCDDLLFACRSESSERPRLPLNTASEWNEAVPPSSGWRTCHQEACHRWTCTAHPRTSCES